MTTPERTTQEWAEFYATRTKWKRFKMLMDWSNPNFWVLIALGLHLLSMWAFFAYACRVLNAVMLPAPSGDGWKGL